MLLFVGLGNPTPDSENNRHNVGFKIIDSINKKFSLSKQKPKFKGLLTTGIVGDQKVYAIKPLTFMNNSGICIRELIEYFKIDPEDVVVFHDDLDVEFGKIKAKFGGSSAGHNGIASIDKFIGKDFQVISLTGNVVYSGTLRELKTQIDTILFPEGIYNVLIDSSTSPISRKDYKH